jgi:hypothetical protein
VIVTESLETADPRHWLLAGSHSGSGVSKIKNRCLADPNYFESEFPFLSDDI